MMHGGWRDGTFLAGGIKGIKVGGGGGQVAHEPVVVVGFQ